MSVSQKGEGVGLEGRATLEAPRLTRLLLVLTIALASVAPVLGYALVFESVPSLRPAEAKAALGTERGQTLLVDVRPADEFAESHLAGAQSWPAAEILALGPDPGPPEPFGGKRLLLLDDGGVDAPRAVDVLRGPTVDAAYVQGGMPGWIASEAAIRPSERSTFVDGRGETVAGPFRSAPRVEQVAAVVAYLGMKPTYMLLTLLLIVVLLRSRAIDLAALRWGLAAFLAGEVACAAGTIHFFQTSQVSEYLEYLHGLGMAICMGLVGFAVFEGLDNRVFHLGDRRRPCAFVGLCGSCSKHADVPCGGQRVLALASAALAVVALIPLGVPARTVSYNTAISGLPYNYSHSVVQQLFEARYCPALAVLLLGAAFLLLLSGRDRLTWLGRVALAAALGPLAFGFLRLTLLALFADRQVWFVFWEEATELVFVVGVGVVLWIFRDRLLGGVSGARGRRAATVGPA